jgi:hypothetical protein
MAESVWWPRMRWRMRGAWQWPTFVALTAVDAVLIGRLPFYGTGPDAPGAIMLATFFNLVVVAALAPLGGMLLRRRRRDLPGLIARDYAGTTLLVLVCLVLVLLGITHRSALQEQRRDLQAVHLGVHNYVMSQAPSFRDGLDAIDTIQLAPDYYRSCVHSPGRAPLCFFVNTDQAPAGVKRDPSREENKHG